MTPILLPFGRRALPWRYLLNHWSVFGARSVVDRPLKKRRVYGTNPVSKNNGRAEHVPVQVQVQILSLKPK
jgi:hypothetical protein